MKRHALFVGVDEYVDPTINKLEFPTEDASELASVFRRLLKFDRVEKLMNPAHAPDVVDSIEEMTLGLGPGDLFLFFFAGHGFRVKENHVLVCTKDKYADLENEYAGLQVGQVKMRMCGPWNQMLVLDACQNDIRTSRGADCGMTSRDLNLIHNSDVGSSGSGVQITVTSCSEGQKALEVSDLRHGLFTSALLDSVTAFADDRRRIDLESLRMDLGGRMDCLIAKYHLVGRQLPMFTMPSNAKDIILLDGIAPEVKNSYADDLRRLDEQRRIAAIRAKEELLAHEERRLREEKQRQEARLQEERRRIEEERRGRDVQSAVKTSLSERKRDNTEDRKPSSVTTASDRPKKCGLTYAVSLRGRMEWCMELYRHFGLDWQLVLKPFVVNFFEWFVRNCMGYVIAAFLIGLVGVVFWLLLYWRYLLENE